MLQRSRELIYAVIAMIFITLGYLLVQVVYGEAPSASSFWGHSIGVLGFVLMLMTETLYSIRKRSKSARWGQMSNWLEFHIFTGLVGPFMVLLHPGWQFNGLAGVLSLLTVLIVISGIIGRYIYTAVPRTADGIQVDLAVMKSQVEEIASKMESLNQTDELEIRSDRMPRKFGMGKGRSDLVESAPVSVQSIRLQAAAGVGGSGKTLTELRHERDRLNHAISRFQAARKLFSFWHAIHIPLGLTLFLIAFIHIGAAIYYAVLLK